MTSQPDDSTMSFRRSQQVTIRDVAEAASVTIGTVSKALNGQGKLRQETRDRIRAVAEQLGFRPNDLAQSLLRGRSYTVGLLTTDSYGRFSIPLLTGIENALGDAQISVFLCDARDDLTRERRYIDSLLAKHVDGIIVTARRTDRRLSIDIGNTHVPVLYAFTQVSDPDALCILPDDAQGARLAAEHLLGHGRRRIAHVSGPDYFESVQLRIEGMREMLRGHGLDLPDERIKLGRWREAWGFQAVDTLLADDPEIDAIFCGSDQIARGVVDGLREHGVRVPDDVAVIGFDNWEVMATAARPMLSTIDMNLEELGRFAGSRLLAMIAGEQESGSGIVKLPCSLVLRDSCGTHVLSS
ncbi:MAG: LacI family DNA-binding transcriptional regulator [Ktedonobacteraceae bacterium]